MFYLLYLMAWALAWARRVLMAAGIGLAAFLIIYAIWRAIKWLTKSS